MFRYLLVLCPASQVHSCVFLSTDTIFAPQTAQFSCNPFALISNNQDAGLPRFIRKIFPDSGAQMKGAVIA